jgi:hypothetical protein
VLHANSTVHPFYVVDMDAKLLVLVRSWQEETFFLEAWRARYNICSPIGKLNYIGEVTGFASR